MGSGISWLLNYRVGNVRLKDINNDSLNKGLQNIKGIYNQLQKRKK